MTKEQALDVLKDILQERVEVIEFAARHNRLDLHKIADRTDALWLAYEALKKEVAAAAEQPTRAE